MRHSFLVIFALVPLLHFSQPNTDIFLFDLNTENGVFELSNMKNISNNEGYDNQPSFLDNNTILYAGTRNGQTDIVKYNINYDSKIFINHTEGSEYSPLKIPGTNAVSAIRLDKDGTQKLYKYNLKNGESEVLVEDIIIGYHLWYNDYILFSSVLENNGLSLYMTDLKKQVNYLLSENIGRSLHKSPYTSDISYISKENDSLWTINMYNTSWKKEITQIAKTLPKTEDFCWASPNTILMGKGSALYTLNVDVYTLDIKNNTDWIEVASLENYGITNITRLAVSPNGKKLAVVGEIISESNISSTSENSEISEAENIVQLQLEAYNNRDIDAFMATYSEDIKLYNYPEELRTEDKKMMRETYSKFFKNTPDLNAFIKNRIVIGNKVIDEEQVTINGKIYNAVAIYEIENGKIKKVTFIQ